jgi:hypothetical protein
MRIGRLRYAGIRDEHVDGSCDLRGKAQYRIQIRKIQRQHTNMTRAVLLERSRNVLTRIDTSHSEHKVRASQSERSCGFCTQS